MITGEMLFNPSQEKYRYTKQDDLLGQQIEIRESPWLGVSFRTDDYKLMQHSVRQSVHSRLNLP